MVLAMIIPHRSPNGFDFRLDVADLLRSLELSAVILDPHLRVRLVTPAAARLVQTDPGEATRGLHDIPGLMAQAHLLDDLRDVLAGGRVIDRLVRCASDQAVRRRSQPLRSQRRSIEGVVVCFGGTDAVRDDRPDARPGPGAAAHPAPIAEQPISNLTPRQREILMLVLAGHPSKRIAAQLGLSARTVENHRASIMHRTGCRSLPELTRLAMQAEPAASQR